MQHRNIGAREARLFVFVTALWLVLEPNLGAQGQGGAAGPAPRTARAMAPKDLTGYWVSVVSEDWRWRMRVPDKGEYQGLPLTPGGTKFADTWDPAKDQVDGNQCRGYGAAAIMQVPGRLHIYWQDDNTLRIDTDSGTQTRLLHFGDSAPQSEAPTWQGDSLASWLRGGYLKAITIHMRPGYLRKNGVPYSGNATLEEYFDRFPNPYVNDTHLMVTRVVTDPQYLRQPLITSTQFKKIPDGSGWDPTPCRADQPR